MADELIKQLGGFAGGESILDGDGRGQKPSEAELLQTIQAPGKKAMLDMGIAYHGPWKFFGDGMGRHTREQVKALATTGLPVRLQSIGQPKFLNEELEDEVRIVEYLERVSFSHTALAVKQFVFHSLPFLREQICPASLREHANATDVGKHTIIYTSWERDRVYPQIIDELKTVAQVWVPCQANKKAFVDSGMPSDQVRVMPYPYDPAACTIAAPRGSDLVPSDRRFYHIGKWEPRKNQHQLLGAFLIAFSPKDRAALTIKTSGFGSTWTGYPTVEESVEFWLDDSRVKDRGWTEKDLNRLVRIIDKRLSDADIQELHKRNNIYISSGLGEAWDIPAFDAKLAGNRLVYVGFGGSEDYALPEDVQIKHGMGPVHSQYDWEPDAKWAKVATEDFAAALSEAKPPEERITPPDYCRRFSYQAVGARMRHAIVHELLDDAAQSRVINSGGFG